MSQNVSILDLNIVIGTVPDAYAALSQLYYLPKRSCKAVNKEYLLKLIVEGEPILKVPKTIPHNYIEYMGTPAADMLEGLEKFLKDNGKPSTGFDFFHIPDYQWLYDVCCWIDPENTIGIKKVQPIANQPLTRLVSKE